MDRRRPESVGHPHFAVQTMEISFAPIWAINCSLSSLCKSKLNESAVILYLRHCALRSSGLALVSWR